MGGPEFPYSPRPSRTTTANPAGSRACQSLISVRLLDPVHGRGHAEHPDEGAGGLLVAGGHGSPLFQPRPETLDPIAVALDPWWTGDVGVVALGRDRGTGAKVADEVAEGMAGVPAVGPDPAGDDREEGQEQRGQRQAVGPSRGPGGARGATGGLGDHPGLGPVTAARPAERLAFVALC